MRFFKKSVPKTPLYLSTGSRIVFLDVGNDTAVYSTDNPGLIAEFEAAIRGERGGIQSITEAEFHGLVEAKKKLTPQSQPSSFILERAGASRVPAEVAVHAVIAKGPPPAPAPPPAPVLPKAEPLVKPDFKPRTGKRGK